MLLGLSSAENLARMEIASLSPQKDPALSRLKDNVEGGRELTQTTVDYANVLWTHFFIRPNIDAAHSRVDPEEMLRSPLHFFNQSDEVLAALDPQLPALRREMENTFILRRLEIVIDLIHRCPELFKAGFEVEEPTRSRINALAERLQTVEIRRFRREIDAENRTEVRQEMADFVAESLKAGQPLRDRRRDGLFERLLGGLIFGLLWDVPAEIQPQHWHRDKLSL